MFIRIKILNKVITGAIMKGKAVTGGVQNSNGN